MTLFSNGWSDKSSDAISIPQLNKSVVAASRSIRICEYNAYFLEQTWKILSPVYLNLETMISHMFVSKWTQKMWEHA